MTQLILNKLSLNYDLGNGVTVSGGKFLNLLGFESDEPTGRYQSSYAYSFDSAAATNGETGRRYAEGIRASFGVEDVAIAVSGYNGLYSNAAADMDLAYDAQVVFSGVENLTVALGYAEDDNSASIAEAVNVWASYESGQVMVAGEYNDVTDGAGNEGDSYLLLANYQINDNASISVRYSELEITGTTLEKFSVSPIYNFTDNLSAFVEYSTGEVNGEDNDSFSIETVFTF